MELHEPKYDGQRRARELELEFLVLVLVRTRGDLVTGRHWNAAEGYDLTSIPVRRTRGGHAGTYRQPWPGYNHLVGYKQNRSARRA
mgnify:CR=1 FL=1